MEKPKCSLGKVKCLCNLPVGVSILLCREKIEIVRYNVISKYTNFFLTGFLVSCSPLLILDTWTEDSHGGLLVQVIQWPMHLG